MSNTTSTEFAPPFVVAQHEIATLVAAAEAGWSGVDWDTGPKNLVAYLAQCAQRVRIGSRVRPLDVDDRTDIGACWWGKREPNSQAVQVLDRRWKELLVEVSAWGESLGADALQPLRAEARALAEAEVEAVSADVVAAAEFGALVVAAVGEGRFEDAKEFARAAAAIERAYGDDPSWGPVEAGIRALPELVANLSAEANYDADGRADAAIVEQAQAERDGLRVCEALQVELDAWIGRGLPEVGTPAHEAWCVRYVVAYTRAMIALATTCTP